MRILHQRSLRVAASIAVFALPQIASAQTFPSRPITIVVPFSAGTGADIVVRAVAERLAKAVRQQVLVDNRLGANGVVAASYVARAAPDGHTLLMATNTAFSANPSLMKNIPYDPVRDFAPISRLGSFALLRVESCVDAKQAGIARRVRKRRYIKCKTSFFAHAPIKPRAASIPENSREQIERGNVRTRDFRDVPGHREMRQLRRKFPVYFSPAKL